MDSERVVDKDNRRETWISRRDLGLGGEGGHIRFGSEEGGQMMVISLSQLASQAAFLL